ncbi:MAG TPA: hypothetical protein VGG19_16945 [Tepidisphaeraceae bacterium]|jgi:hypothetical protein
MTKVDQMHGAVDHVRKRWFGAVAWAMAAALVMGAVMYLFCSFGFQFVLMPDSLLEHAEAINWGIKLLAIAIAIATFVSTLRYVRSREARETKPARHPFMVMLTACFAIGLAGFGVYLMPMVLKGVNPFGAGMVSMLGPEAMGRIVVVFPFFYFGLRDRPLRKSMAIIVVLVIGELVVVEYWNVEMMLYGTYAAFAAGVIIARWWTNQEKGNSFSLRQNNRPIAMSILLMLLMAGLLAMGRRVVTAGQREAEQYVRNKWGSQVDDGDVPGGLAVAADRDRYSLPYAIVGLAIDAAALLPVLAMFWRRRFVLLNAAMLSVWIYFAGGDVFDWMLMRLYAGR